MLRRTFFKFLLGSALIPIAVSSARPSRARLLQQSPLAGFQFYDGSRLWPALAIGQPLTLAREPGNPYDARAVAVCWRGSKLGYLPRAENAAIAQLMDRVEPVQARIAGLSERGGPWDRMSLSIYLTA